MMPSSTSNFVYWEKFFTFVIDYTLDIVRSEEWFLRKLSKCSNVAREQLKSQEDLLKIILRSASSPKQVRERTSRFYHFHSYYCYNDQHVSFFCLSDFPHQKHPFCVEPVIIIMVETGRHSTLVLLISVFRGPLLSCGVVKWHHLGCSLSFLLLCP